MVKRLLLITAATTLFLAGCKNNGAKKSEKKPVLGTIDGEKITTEEFDYVYKKNNSKNQDAYSKASIDEYLDLYMNFRLKVREAESLGYDTTAEFKNEFKDYERQLAEPYLTEKSVSEKLIKEAYDRSTKEVNASHLLIMVKEDAAPKDTLMAYNKVKKYREMATSGKGEFGDLAKRFSEDPSAKQNGGNLGYFTAMQMVYPFENAAYNTKVGEISNIVRTRFGYHILKVHDKRGARGRVKVAHIMRRATEGMDEVDLKAAEAKINEIHKKVTEGGDWNSLAKQFSEDGSSASRGGELKWFGAGQMPAAFDEVSFSLKEKGDISKPIKTAYGYHIIKLIDKKGIPSFEEMKPELESKIQRDVRSQLPKEAFIKRIKKENNFKENVSVKEEIFKLADSTFLTPEWKYDENNSTYGKTLFSVADKNYTGLDFLGNIKNQLRPKNGNAQNAMANLYKSYWQKELIDYEKANLENKYIDYRMLLQEYRDGILLFKLMDEKVWSKAVQDTAGLRAFHQEKSSNYMWEERAKTVILNAASEDVLKMAKEDIKNPRFLTSKYSLNPISFEGKSTSIKGETIPEIDKIVGYLNANKNLSVDLTGYTDSYGKEKTNLTIGSDRADFVKNYLVKREIAESRIKTLSKGEANPIGSNKTKEGKAQNNRVEIKFYTSSLKGLEEKYNKENSLNITVTEGVFEKGDNAILDEVEWNTGEYALNKGGRAISVNIMEIKAPTKKKLNECKGLVISDYQNHLEKEWVKELKKKYPVVIDQAEVDKLIKQ